MTKSITQNLFWIVTFTLFFSNQSLAGNCSSLGAATELSSASGCSAGSTGTCTLSAGTTYKITSATTSSVTTLLPPIVIPSTSELCIDNSILTGPLDIFAQSFWVQGGVFQIGSSASPITSDKKVTITMAGASSAAMAPQPICAASGTQTNCSHIAKKTIEADNARDITVSDGGQLLMYGVKGLTPISGTNYIHSIDYQAGTVEGNTFTGDINQKPYFNNQSGSNSWTYLRHPAGPDYFNSSLHVQAPVASSNFTDLYLPAANPSTTASKQPTTEDLPYLLALSNMVADGSATDWQSGDWISISTTTFSSHETEMVQICDVYAMANPDLALPSGIKSKYDDVTGPTALPYITVLALAGSPTYGTNCSQITAATPLKHYHFGSASPTPGFFSSNTSYTNADGTTFSAKKGQAYSMYDGESNNFGIDERAEVALLSRSIKLTAATNTSSTSLISNLAGKFFGGHIAIMNHNSTQSCGHTNEDQTSAPHHAATPPPPDVKVELVGVEIEKFGQPLVGRYPIHFHLLNKASMTEDSNPLLVQDSVVHHSFNKCFVTHDTMGTQFYNNACIRTIGQGVYLEDGYNIAGNNFVRNLVAGTMSAELNYDMSKDHVYDGGQKIGNNTYWDGDYLAQQTGFNYAPVAVPDASDSGANTDNYIDSFTPGGFWITTFGSWDATTSTAYPNIFVNNSVAGCQMLGSAYWLVKQDVENINQIPYTDPADLYPVFTGNRGHGCYNGLVAATDFSMNTNASGPPGPAPKPAPVGSAVNDEARAPLTIFDSVTMSQIENKAFWYRGVFVGVNNGRFSSLKQGMTLLGGGGPEGNLLGFWGLVHNSVFAGVTNNNVGRYSDCEGYYNQIGKGDITMFPGNALPLQQYNEMAKCAPIDMTNVSNSPKPPKIGNNSDLFGAIVTNFNFQGYTFYDGPARMEDNRFINFRADPTSPTLYDNASNSYSGTRHLTTIVDAYRMLNFGSAGQLASYTPPSPEVGYTYHWGTDNYYGAEGDAAFSWLKGNAQSVPPTQYAKGSLWDNVNFKHQVFTEISNLQAPLGDGDKQTVEIDRDTTLSGYSLCAKTNTSQCSCNLGTSSDCGSGNLDHYPISLNNLNVFATPYTVDEPHTRGRNNVVSTALMSPHKYATVNVEVADQKHIDTLTVDRDMLAYSSEAAQTTMSGRGGKKYIYEAMVMNNMGYTYSTQNFKPSSKGQTGQTQLMFSYSDAPVDTNFINRVGICVGTGISESSLDVEINKTQRQWNYGETYLNPAPEYWKSKYGLTGTSCPSVVTKKDAYATCKSSGTAVNGVTKKVLNTNYYNALDNNYNLNTTNSFSEGYYYDSASGILYFNMMQNAESSGPSKPVTPPFGTCDSANYATGNKTRTDIVDYLKFSDANSIGSTLDVGCYADSTGTPQTSELLTCPPEGCAVYTVGFTLPSGSDSPTCTTPSWSAITDGDTPSIHPSTHAVTYSAPYILYNNTATTPLSSKIKSVSVNIQGEKIPSSNGVFSNTRSTHYLQGGADSTTPPSAGALLPLTKAVYQYTSEDPVADPIVMNQDTPDNINTLSFGQAPLPGGTIYTISTGSGNAGIDATIEATSGAHFYQSTTPYTHFTSLEISSTTTTQSFYYYESTATVSFSKTASSGSVSFSCTVTFADTSPYLSLGTESGCAYLRIVETSKTINVDPYPASSALWNLNTGASSSAGQSATLTAASSTYLVKNDQSNNYPLASSVAITPSSSGNTALFYYRNATASITIGSGTPCNVVFDDNKNASTSCTHLSINNTNKTLTVAK